MKVLHRVLIHATVACLAFFLGGVFGLRTGKPVPGSQILITAPEGTRLPGNGREPICLVVQDKSSRFDSSGKSIYWLLVIGDGSGNNQYGLVASEYTEPSR